MDVWGTILPKHKSTIFVQHIKNSTVNILLRSGGERCEHKQSSSSSLFIGAGGGGHHLFSCQDELMFTRNKKKKKTSQSVFLPEWEMMQPRHPSAGVAARCYMMPPDPLTFENGLLRPVVLRHDGGLHVGRTLYASVLWVWSQPLLLWFVCFGAGSVP